MGHKWVNVDLNRKFFSWTVENLVLDISLLGQLVLQAVKTETE